MGKYDEIEPGLGTYHAVYERDEDGAWIVHVKEVPICHTYGRSIDQARTHIREALGLFHDDAESAEIVDEFKLGEEFGTALHGLRSARRAEAVAQLAVASARSGLLEVAAEHDLAAADVASVLGVSRQRVYKMMQQGGVGEKKAKGKKARRTSRTRETPKRRRRPKKAAG